MRPPRWACATLVTHAGSPPALDQDVEDLSARDGAAARRRQREQLAHGDHDRAEVASGVGLSLDRGQRGGAAGLQHAERRGAQVQRSEGIAHKAAVTLLPKSETRVNRYSQLITARIVPV